MASHPPGVWVQAGVAVGLAAAVVAVLRSPLSTVGLATLLTVHAGNNVEPLITVGSVVAYIATLVISRTRAPRPAPGSVPVPGPAPSS